METEDVLLKTNDALLKTEDNRKWAQVNWTQCSLGHWIPLLRVGLGLYLSKGKPDPKADQMSSWPTLVSHLGTRCLSWEQVAYGSVQEVRGHKRGEGGIGRLHLTKGQPDPKADQMSSRPTVVWLVWAQVNWNQISTSLGH